MEGGGLSLPSSAEAGNRDVARSERRRASAGEALSLGGGELASKGPRAVVPARPPLASSSAQSWSFTSGRGEALSSKAASCDTNPLKKGGTQEPRKKAEEWVLSWLPGFLLRVFLTTRLWR